MARFIVFTALVGVLLVAALRTPTGVQTDQMANVNAQIHNAQLDRN